MQANASKGLLIAGYIFALLGGLIGIGIGAHLAMAKVEGGAAGEKVAKYSEASRTQGKIILGIGVVMLIVGRVVTMN